MIIVAGKLFVDPSNRSQFIKGSIVAIQAARDTEGCLDFSVSADELDKGRVNIFELWKTKKALEAFRGSGPGEDLSSLILRYDINQYEVKA